MTRQGSRTAHAGLAALVAAALLAGACGGDDESAGEATTTVVTTGATATTTAPTPAPGATTAPTTAPGGTGGTGAGCTGGAPAVPAGAAEGEVPDLDGDGRADRAYLATGVQATRLLGVVTAAGGGAEVAIESAGPQPLSLLAVDADEAAPAELFVSDGRTAQLWAFADCAIAPVTNPEGEQYLFDLGFRGTGTGVGCHDAGDGRRLVGLNVTDDDGTTVAWTRTVIERDGLSASNGATDEGRFTHGADDEAIDLLHTISCGDRTIADDGIAQPQA